MRCFFNGLVLSVIAVLMMCCGTAHQIPGQDSTQVTTVIRDSVRVKDSTIFIQIPIERIVDVVPVYDTLKLETTLAQAEAYVDTLTHTLKGNIVNRRDSIKVVVKYLDRKVEILRDSIQVKEVPVEVEVIRKVIPKWVWYLLVFNVLVLLILGVRFYLKLKT